jgi:acyl-CoA thioesterase-2
MSDLMTSLELDEIGALRFRGRHTAGERGVVFGGQLIAQMAVAAARADETAAKPIKSIHALFARPVLVGEDVEIGVDVLHAGRAFASATVALWQDGRECARAMALLSAPEPDLIRHAVPMPDVGGPDDATPRSGLDGLEVRAAGDVDIDDAEAVGPAESHFWVRFPGAPPDDHAAGQGLVALASASFLIGTAMRLHASVGQSQAHRAISTGIIGHTVSFHDDIDARGWLLLANESPVAARGRALGTGHVFTPSGGLVASYSQEAMIRHFPEGRSAAGRESTVL